MMGRNQLCERLFNALEGRTKTITLEQFSSTLSDWDLIDVGGAVVMLRDAEIHVAAPKDRRGRWISRARIKTVLGGILQSNGVVRTKVMKDNEAGNAFVSRLGFQETGRDASTIHYELKELRHA
jgi:hypothetical protein